MTIISPHHQASPALTAGLLRVLTHSSRAGISKAAISEEPREASDCNRRRPACSRVNCAESTSELIAINVEPAPTLEHEAAALMQAYGTPRQTIAGDEFDLC